MRKPVMPHPVLHHYASRDGVELTYQQIGAGRPFLLLHGFLSSAALNWIRPGHAETIAARGYRVILPDLRAHGYSARPDDPRAYPPDVLVEDALRLIDHLDLADFDLGGYSLGARTVGRLLARGAHPARVVFGGIGLASLESDGGSASIRQVITQAGPFPPGSEGAKLRALVRLRGEDPARLLHVLDSSLGTSREELARRAVPSLVIVGADDPLLSGAMELAELLPDSQLVVIAGNHTSCVGPPDLGRAMSDFLGTPPGVSAA
jgi:pimeloyl-ACP methyl ester carboxylesterase